MTEDLCKIFDEKVEAYLAGDLFPAEKAEFDEHLAACPRCWDTRMQARMLERHLEGVREEPPAALLDGVLAGVRREKKKRPLMYLGKLLPMAACLALVVSAILLFPSIASQQKGENYAPDMLPNAGLAGGTDGDLSFGDKNDVDEIETNAEAEEEQDSITPAVTDSASEDRPIPAPPLDTAPPAGTRPPASTDLPTVDVPATEAPFTEAPDDEEIEASRDDTVASENDTAATPETEAEQVPATEGVETQAPSSESEADDETGVSAENGVEDNRSSLLGALFLAIHIALILVAVGVVALLVFFLIGLRRNGR